MKAAGRLAAVCASFVLALLALPALLLLGATGGGEAVSGAAPVEDIPPGYVALYRAAGTSRGIDWAVLAAIGAIESDHGRSSAPGVRSGVNFAGCCAGPMQFDVTPEGGSTWAAYGVDGDGDGRRDPYDPEDAIPAAADYLVANGAPNDYPRAVFAYNHSEDYVQAVLALAARYRRGAAGAPAASPSGGFVYPVRDHGGRPTGSFSDDYRGHRGSGGHCPDHPTWHCAIDVFAPRGTLLVAPITGRITRLGPSGLGGNRLWIEADGDRFYLAHLSAFAPGLAEGQHVAAGQAVGRVGDTGSARGTSPHLHIAWERRLEGGWRNENPYSLLRTARDGRG
ncbi:peptidoglycan DD-metalloendopeptidase family protein [Miltoncostaea marina]|uniref:peptidoglycan DD-metalloendopeptidase family protein n=1 Tax=Miltoncostaea marina TaxID=2843215 RepID=UPI001C3D016F|nr:peptidoglycan DD-metalloendopeptidase family protein [Miltoncostaea marina]